MFKNVYKDLLIVIIGIRPIDGFCKFTRFRLANFFDTLIKFNYVPKKSLTTVYTRELPDLIRELEIFIDIK